LAIESEIHVIILIEENNIKICFLGERRKVMSAGSRGADGGGGGDGGDGGPGGKGGK